MKVRALREQGIYPSAELVQDFLGEVYGVWKELVAELTQGEFPLTFEWFFIPKNKLWLCQANHWQTPVFWLSVWDKFFKILFQFTEQELKDVLELDISEQIKEVFSRSKPIGKTFHVFLKINKREQLVDVLKIIKVKTTSTIEKTKEE